MRRDPNGNLPVVGTTSSSELGARPGPDVTIDQVGNVVLDGKGMSVAPAWRDLPYTRIPRRLNGLFPGAAGSNANSCFVLGAGPFQASAVTADLELIPDAGPPPVRHGVVAPARVMTEGQYNGALAATRPDWVIDET
jgi:hypothetical protein